MTRNLEEKRGGIKILDPSSTTFNETIEDLHMVEISPKHGLHTLKNGKESDHQVDFRLDRFILS